MAVNLDRSSSDGDIKDAYDKGLSIDTISRLTERSADYVTNLVYVDPNAVTGVSVEQQILSGNTDQTATVGKK